MTTTLSLECSIDVPGSRRLGEPILVTGTLRNGGPTGVWVLPWATFLAGPVGDYTQVWFEGDCIPYDGLYVRRREPQSADFIYLGSGQARSGTIDLSEMYAIANSGVYDLRFDLRVRAAEGERDTPPTDTDHGRVQVTSPAAQLRLEIGTVARQTAGQRMRANAAEPSPAGKAWTPPKSPVPPQISGTDDNEMIDQIHLAWDRGYQASVKAWTLLQTLAPPNVDYQDWFGAFSTQNAQTVLTTFQSIILWMSNPKQAMEIRVGTAATNCNNGDYGTSVYHSTWLTLCDAVFGSTVSAWLKWTDWDDERMITVVHEMSHIASNTGDDYNGEAECAEVAETDPAEAVLTADNYGYFALAVEGSYQEPGNGVWTGNTKPFSTTIQDRPAVAVTESGGSLIVAWQDSSSWLYVNELNVSKGTWGSKSKFANPASPSKYLVAASGPAVAAVGTTFYLLYIDGDMKSPTFNALMYLQSPDFGEHWSTPTVVVYGPLSVTSPALVSGPGGLLYGVFAEVGGSLTSLVGTPATDGAGVTWSGLVSLNLVSSVEPALCCYGGSFYFVTVPGNGSAQIHTSLDFVTWTPGPVVPLLQTSAAPALCSWSVPGEPDPWLMCTYRGLEPDPNLHYVVYDGALWGVPVRQAQNLSKTAPAVAAFGSTLFVFHRGNKTNNLYWSRTQPAGKLAAALKRSWPAAT